MLSQREWKGNIRELEHLIEHAMIIENGGSISAATIAKILPESPEHVYREPAPIKLDETNLDIVVSEYEASHISKVLMMTNGNRVKAAKLLGISRSVLYEKIRRYAISKYAISKA